LFQDVRHHAIGAVYRLGGAIAGPLFQKQISLEQLARARILILKPCCLGDVVFATPLIRELRRVLPGATISFGVGRHSRAAVEGNPLLDELLDTGAVGSGHYGRADFLALADEMRSRRFDACFVLERSAVIGLLPLVAGISLRIGIDGGGRGFAHGVRVSARPARPESELYLDLFRAIGGKPTSGQLEFHPPLVAKAKADKLIRDRIPDGRPFVLLHCAGGTNPGMALARKRWPTKSFADLGCRIRDAGVVVVLVGASDDRDVAQHFLGQMRLASHGEIRNNDVSANGIDGVVDLVGELGLAELAALASRACVYVGNDSGPTHLAEAAGARVVMLFGPSDPIVYGPRSRRAISLTGGMWCSPCFVDGRFPPCANVICMSSISVDRVWAEVARLIKTGVRQ
jgi:ADP-heptose:LPS heptosyltransferase